MTGARDRFLALDAYRVDREWKRYEGTPQRDLFRELRLRFIERHSIERGWAVDVGCGPGRFLPHLGAVASRRAGFDLSMEMLRSARSRLRAEAVQSHVFRADAYRPPVRAGCAQLVAVLGNTIGFAGGDAGRVIDASARLVGPGGRLLLETAPGPGERSRYLSRLPPGAVRRLMAAPVNLVRGRVEREGFLVEARGKTTSGFERISPTELIQRLQGAGLSVIEMIAVAPALGADPLRIAVVRPDPDAWRRLLEVEEAVGRSVARHPGASALLVAAERVGTRTSLGRTDVLSKRR